MKKKLIISGIVAAAAISGTAAVVDVPGKHVAEAASDEDAGVLAWSMPVLEAFSPSYAQSADDTLQVS